MSHFKKYLSVFIFILGGIISLSAQTIGVFYDASVPQFEFAANDVKVALESHNFKVELKSLSDLSSNYTHKKIVLALNSDLKVTSLLQKEGGDLSKLEGLGTQAFSLQTTHKKYQSYWALGVDVIGTLYGGLQLAENINFNGMSAHYDKEQSPYIEKRGIKCNIALDRQITSLKSTGDQDQLNLKDIWDLDFWKEYMDELVRMRYNVVSFWIKHPFPAMVKLDDYPEVALADVTNNKGEVIKRMSIDEKIAFWQEVLLYAENRSIETYFITWNIEMHVADGKHGISEDGDNETTVDYVRKSVEAFLLNYPTVVGIGVTAGEHMPKMTDDEKEIWLWRTYGKGILDAKKETPDREIRFIHRYWWTNVDDILKHFKDYKDPFDFSFKYARAHMYSSTNPPFEDFLYEQFPEDVKCWWNIRNDDIFYYRWGNPDYAREFILNFNLEKTAGYYMGSDGYTWGRVYSSKHDTFQGKLEFQKHWYNFMLWGRLGYNPQLTNEVFKNHIKWHFPEAPTENIFEAWSSASLIIPQFTRFFWRDWDSQWYPEGCKSNKFVTVNDVINGKTMDSSGIMTIPEYVVDLTQNITPTQITPVDVANNLADYAANALGLIADIDANETTELALTLNDIRAFSYLGKYYSEKTRGATAIAIYDATNDSAYYRQSITHMNNALGHWKTYAAISNSQYYPRKMSRTGTMNWDVLTREVEKDILLVTNRSVPLTARISLTKNGLNFMEGQNLDVVVKVEPPVGILQVDLYLNNELIRSAKKSPYEWGYASDEILKNVSAGLYEFKAVVKTEGAKEVYTTYSVDIPSRK